MLANVVFPDSILLRECAPDLRAEAESDRDVEIRKEGLGYYTSPPQLMPSTGISTSGVYSTCHRLLSGQQHPGPQCCWPQTRQHTTNANRETFTIKHVVENGSKTPNFIFYNSAELNFNNNKIYAATQQHLSQQLIEV